MRGKRVLTVGDYMTPFQRYTAYIRIKKQAMYYCNRADTYLEYNQYDKALQDARASIRLDPQLADVSICLCQCNKLFKK